MLIVINFPVICCDDFFQQPDLIREWLLSLEYKSTSNGIHNGTRTDNFFDINREFHNKLAEKICSLYFNLEYDFLNWETLSTCATRSSHYVEEKNDIRNRSWIHKDMESGPIIWNGFAGIIYLNKEVEDNDECGTSLFEISDKSIEHMEDLSYEDSELKKQFHLGHIKEKKSLDTYIIRQTEWESKFKRSICFANYYNRIVIFPLDMWHRIDNFGVGTGEDRLTLNFWFRNIYEISKFPIERVNNGIL